MIQPCAMGSESPVEFDPWDEPIQTAVRFLDCLTQQVEIFLRLRMVRAGDGLAAPCGVD